VAALAKRYKIYRKKEDLEKLEALLRSQSSRISRSNSMTSADKDDFIDMLIKVTANNSPVRETHTQILDRFLKK
jgi:hypothetical protein